jgi:hypothetical protein
MRRTAICIVLVSLLSACLDSSGPPFGDSLFAGPEQLQLSVELQERTITTAQVLHMRLVARNPLAVPVRYSADCGSGLEPVVSDSAGPLNGEGAIGCAPEPGRHLVRLAPGDSLVLTTAWQPRYYVGSGSFAPRPPGPYAVAAALRAVVGVVGTSPPATFELTAAP